MRDRRLPLSLPRRLVTKFSYAATQLNLRRGRLAPP